MHDVPSSADLLAQAFCFSPPSLSFSPDLSAHAGHASRAGHPELVRPVSSYPPAASLVLPDSTLSSFSRHVWGDVSSASTSTSSSPTRALASTTQAAKARPDDSEPAFSASSSPSTTDSHGSSSARSTTSSSASHGTAHRGSPNSNGGQTHRPHAVSFSSTSPVVPTHHVPRPVTQPSPEQQPHSSPPQRPHPQWHSHDSPRRGKSGMIVGIVFGVLGGIAGFFLLFAFGRCVHSWRRTPGRDRIRTMMDRHYLEREMQEREREDIERRFIQVVPFRRPPPPPYQHAPAYDAVIGDEHPRTPSPSSSRADSPTLDEPPLPSSATPLATEPRDPPSPRIEARREEHAPSDDSRHAARDPGPALS